MLSEKSIKKKFILQLIAASVALIAIFSIVLYNYIKISILDDITASLKSEAELIMKEDKLKSPFTKKIKTLSVSNSVSKVQDKIEVQIRVDKEPKVSFEEYEKDGRKYLSIYYPYDRARSSFLTIT